jgi:putative hemolysin
MKKKKKQFRSELTKLLLLLLLLGVLIAFGIYYNLNQEAIVNNIDKVGNGNVSIANPASTYCIENKGELEIRKDEDGGEYGVCVFGNGKECEEWAFFRGECDNKCFDIENKAILSSVLEKEGLEKNICNYSSKIYKDDGNFYYGTLDEDDFIYDKGNDEVIFIGKDLPKCSLLDEKNISIEIVNMCFDDSENIIERFEWEEYINEDYGINFKIPKNIDESLYKLESFPNEIDNSLFEISQNLIDYSDCSNPKTEEIAKDYVILDECGKYLCVFKNKNYFHIMSGTDLELLQRIININIVK